MVLGNIPPDCIGGTSAMTFDVCMGTLALNAKVAPDCLKLWNVIPALDIFNFCMVHFKCFRSWESVRGSHCDLDLI